ncbi:hypothetical protein D770_02800 [Flammeovirgaceae bacterium 311]|nr:hypothetical protein D770_02800 [Flammeovirgaceae bacterium 311]
MGKYVYNSSLPFVKANFNGNRVNDDQFTNYPYPDPDPSFKKVIKWKLSTNPQKKEKKADTFKLIPQFLPQLPEAPDSYLIWLGHATFLIKLGDVTILTDPIVGKLPFIRRKAPLPIAVDEIKGIDYILISHAHRDHYDQKSLNKILKNNPGVEVLGPLRISNLLNKLPVQPPHQEAGWYQQFEVKKDVKLVYLPAIHWHRRGLFDLNEILWGSFYISDRNKSIFFAGDTAYNKHFKTIADVMGKTNICLMPIGAYKPEAMMQSSHLSPDEAVKAFNQLNAEVMIPMHYGTFDISDEPLGEPIRRLESLTEEGILNGKLQVLQPGEIFPI